MAYCSYTENKSSLNYTVFKSKLYSILQILRYKLLIQVLKIFEQPNSYFYQQSICTGFILLVKYQLFFLACATSSTEQHFILEWYYTQKLLLFVNCPVA